MKVEKITIDIVLLLPKKIADICIRVNQNDPKRYMTFGKDVIPHITLVMGIISKNDIKKISALINAIAKKYLPIELEISKFQYELNDKNTKHYAFEISITKKLLNLQQEILRKIAPYLKHNKITKAMFYNSDINLETKRNFASIIKTQTDMKSFQPHITLLCSRPKYDKFPIQFTAGEIALCHLGRHGTCRKILYHKNYNLI